MTNGETSAILGIGNDIIEIERIRASLAQHGARFLARLFTDKEQEYCLKHKDPIPRIAGRFCAKEALAKALGTGFGEHLSWLDLEILNDTAGKPIVLPSDALQTKLQGTTLLVTISHCHLYATAMALWIKGSSQAPLTQL